MMGKKKKRAKKSFAFTDLITVKGKEDRLYTYSSNDKAVTTF